MSEAKFTKGPWSTDYRKDFRGMYNQDVFDKNGENICQCCWYPVKEGNAVTTTNREANANLIAAAPEMYDAIEAALRIDQLWTYDVCDEEHAAEAEALHSMRQKFIDALAKARGEA